MWIEIMSCPDQARRGVVRISSIVTLEIESFQKGFFVAAYVGPREDDFRVVSKLYQTREEAVLEMDRLSNLVASQTPEPFER